MIIIKKKYRKKTNKIQNEEYFNINMESNGFEIIMES